MPEERALSADVLLKICRTDGIPIGGAKVSDGWYYDPYYFSGTEEFTEVVRVDTWYSPDQTNEVAVFAIVTSLDPACSHVESWLVCRVEDEGDWGTYHDSYVLPFSALKKYFQRWLKELRKRR